MKIEKHYSIEEDALAKDPKNMVRVLFKSGIWKYLSSVPRLKRAYLKKVLEALEKWRKNNS